MFFNAFNVEVRDPLEKIEVSKLAVAEPKEIELTTNVAVNIKSETKATDEKKEESKSETTIPEKKLVDSKTTEKPLKTYNSIRDMIRESEQKNAATSEKTKRKTVLPGADLIIPKQQKGYYVVANVFAVQSNTTRFTAKLNKKGLQPQVLYNPNTNYDSVYLAHFRNWSDALDYYYSNAEGTYFDDLWIMLVNTSTGNIL
jgi:trehalose/maltose hydrolase-like predicted phosphorylase